MGLLIAAADIYIYVSFGRECLLPIVYVWVSTLAAKGKNPLVYRLEYVIHRRTGCRRAVSQPSLKAKNTFGTRLQAPTFSFLGDRPAPFFPRAGAARHLPRSGTRR